MRSAASTVVAALRSAPGGLRAVLRYDLPGPLSGSRARQESGLVGP